LYPSSLARPMNHSSEQPKCGGRGGVQTSNISEPSLSQAMIFFSSFYPFIVFSLPNLLGFTSAQW
jgi:hypothetical protein